MALILYSALISTIRGKLQGSIFSKSGAGQTIGNRGIPRSTPTENQLVQRSGFTANAYRWAALTEQQRQDWRSLAATKPVTNRIGEIVFLSGWLYFRKIQSLVSPLGSGATVFANPLAPAAVEANYTVTQWDIEAVGSNWKTINLIFFGINIGATTTPQFILIYISNPVSVGQTGYFGTYYRLSGRITTVATGANTLWFRGLNDMILPPGFFTFPGALHRFKFVAVIPESGSIAVEKFADFMPTIILPVVFPTLAANLAAPNGVSPMWLPSTGRIIGNMSFVIGNNTINYSAVYRIQIQAGEPQSTTAPIDPSLYNAQNQFSFFFDAAFDNNQFTTGTPLANFFAWYNSTFGPYPTTQVGKFLPFQARLFEISSGDVGPWTTGYFVVKPF
jgi:hypothetical protein